MAEAALCLGANLGDPPARLAEARERLAAAGLKLVHASAIYRTPPWGPVPQGDYANQCLLVETGLSPLALLDTCLHVEAAMGRVRDIRYGPRIIDIDVLTYDNLFLDHDRLTLPHPRLLERAFVLVPLAEIAPDLMVGGIKAGDALKRIDTGGIRLWEIGEPAIRPRRLPPKPRRNAR